MLNLAYNTWGDDAKWRKKYDQPGFDVRKNVVVVEENGEWAGGGTAWFREAILGNERKATVYTAGDLYVHPNHRGKGIYSSAMKALNKMAYDREAVLGFAFPSIYRLPSIALPKYGFVDVLYPKTRILILNPEKFLGYILSLIKEAYLPSKYNAMIISLTVKFDLPQGKRSITRIFRVENGALLDLAQADKIDLKVTMAVDLLLKISSRFYLGTISILPTLLNALLRRRLGVSFSLRFAKAVIGL